MKKILFALLLSLSFTSTNAQLPGGIGFRLWKTFTWGSHSFGKGPDHYADTSAWVDFPDTSKRGIVIPPVISVDSVYSPKKGLMVYELTSSLLRLYNGSSWDTLGIGTGGGGGSAVVSVNGYTGVVVLELKDILDAGYRDTTGSIVLYDGLLSSRLLQLTNTTNTFFLSQSAALMTAARAIAWADQSGTPALIAQTITNGLLNTCPSEDAVYDALATYLLISKYTVRETPSGAINGSNVTYTLAGTPVAGTEEVYLNGQLQQPGAGNDYTISGGTITYLSPPISTDKIFVTYISQ